MRIRFNLLYASYTCVKDKETDRKFEAMKRKLLEINILHFLLRKVCLQMFFGSDAG
jgi:hypothetical protein